jgi:hypothetical protein
MWHSKLWHLFNGALYNQHNVKKRAVPFSETTLNTLQHTSCGIVRVSAAFSTVMLHVVRSSVVRLCRGATGLSSAVNHDNEILLAIHGGIR